MRYIDTIPDIQPVLQGAHHIDVKTVTVNAPLSLREFIAGMLAYQPGWVTFLYGVRMVFVRFLGMKQPGIPKAPRLTPETVPMIPGEPAAFFNVRLAKEEAYWFAEIKDQHLNAALGVVVEPLTETQKCFHVVTVVHYNHWTGPIYFNIIRPFHHLVVGSMARAGAKQA